MGGINPKKQIYLTISFCILLTNGIYAGTCKKGCTRPDNGKLKYQPGSVYEYQFDSLISIGVPQTGEKSLDETAVKVQGLAKLYANGNCDYQVQLSNYVITTQRNGAQGQTQKQFSNADLQDPVSFLLSNGELETNICQNSNPKESDHALNLKRAVISMFQSTGNEYETDIFGVCAVQRTQVGNIITTHRDLNECAYREKFVNGFIQSIVNMKSGIKSSVYLQGNSVKTQKISAANVFEDIELIEEYKFMPNQQIRTKPNSLSDAQSAVETTFVEKYVGLAKVRTTLKLTKTSAGRSAPIAAGKEVSIIYDYVGNKPVKNLEQLKKSLDKTVSLVQRHTQFQSAKYFTDIIRLMRQADAATLIELSGTANSNIARKVFLDALFRVGTKESVKALAKQIPKLSEKEKRMAFLSFMLVQDPVDKDTLKEVSALLSTQPMTESYLSIGNLLNLYCDKNECDSSSNIFVTISQKFVDALKHCKFQVGNKKEETRIVGVLKGIRNTKKLADQSAQKLLECVEPDRSARIRVAALQAFSASNCNESLKQKLLQILKNRNEDSEIRIEAYLALVACPTRELATELAELLQTEEVNQVGTFLTTHLKSIRDSTDFTRESQRYYLGNIRLPVKFPVDPRKFSFNTELSYSMDSLGLSASTDLSMIYSQSGFLPRSVRLNITTEVYGKSFNFIELGARQENLEDILEYYFGPKGYFTREPQDFVDKFDALSRSKRSVADSTNKIFKSYKTYGSDKYHSDLNFDLSLKLFGTEFGFLSLGDAIPTTTNELVQLFGQLSQKTKLGLKNYQKQFEYHGTLEDFGLRYPTGSGFPLELTEQTVLVGKLDFGTEIDVDKNLADTTSSKYRVKLIPSADLYSNFQIKVDAGVLEAGIIVDTNVNSASGGDYKLDLLHNNHGFHFNVDFPRNEIDIIEVKYDVNFFIAEHDKEIILHPLNVNLKRSKAGGESKLEKCFEQLGESLGLQLCYVANMPDPEKTAINSDVSYLSPVHFGVKLKTERKIQLSGLYQYHQDHQSWMWIYDTPESQVPHKTEVKFELGADPKIYARLSLDNPKMRHSIETGLQNDDREFALYAKVEDNGDKRISKIGFTKTSGGREYHPLIQVQDKNGIRNDIAGYKADGKILVEEKSGADSLLYKFDNFRVIRPNNQQTLFNGWIELAKTKLSAELKVQEQEKRYLVNANMGINQEQKEVKVSFYISDEAKKDENTFGGELAVQATEHEVKNNLVLRAGTHVFHLLNDYKMDGMNVKFQHAIEFKQNRDIILSGKLNGEHDEKLIMIDFEAQRNDKKLAALYKFSHSQKTPTTPSNYLVDYDLELNLKLNRHYLELKSHSDLKSNQKYHLDTNLVTSWGTKANFKGDIQNIEPVQLNLNGNFQISKTDSDNSFNLKAINTQNKQNFEFTFARNKVNLIQSTVEIQKAADKPLNGKLTLLLKDNLNAKGDFKFNGKNGRGDVNVLINLLKKPQDQQKVQLNSKFLIQSPKYDVDTTLQFDGNRKIHFKTENIVDSSEGKQQAKQAPEQKSMKFSTKNLFELNQEKTQFDMQYQMNGVDFKFDSELDMKFELQLPIGRKFTGHGKRKMHSKQHKGEINFYLDESKSNNEKRSIQLTGQLTDFNKKYQYFNVIYNLVYSKFDGKKIELQLAGKNVPKSGSIDSESELTTGLISVKVTGSEFDVPKLLDVNVVLSEIGKSYVNYNIAGKYRNNHVLNLNGNFNSGADAKKPCSFEANGDLAMGSERYTMKSNGKFKFETDLDDKFDIVFNMDSQIPQNGQMKDLNINLVYNGNSETAVYKLNSNCPWHGKMSIDGNYIFELNDEKNDLVGMKSKVNYNLGHYGQAQQEFSMEWPSEDEIKLNYKMHSNYESLKEIDYSLRGQIFNNSDPKNDRVEFNSNLLLNGQKYAMKSIVFNGDQKTGIDLNIMYPTYSTIILATQEVHNSPSKVILNLNLQNILHENDFDLAGNADILYNLDKALTITGNLNSVKFNLNKIQYEFQIKDADASSKAVEFKITRNSGQENILRGQAQYRTTADEKTHDIQFQGSGNIFYFDKEMNANFKLTKQHFTNDPHGELGWSYQFNGKFGPKNLVSTIKITNKDFHIKFATCEESKQCTNFEIQSLLRNAAVHTETGPQLQQHELMVLIDLRELKFPYEFELQIKTTTPAGKNVDSILSSGKFPYVSYWQNIAQEIEMNIISNSNHKYQLLINLKPQKGVWKLKLPKREIVLEYDEKLPDLKFVGETGFTGEFERKLIFYFDKLNKPKEKTQLSMQGEVNAQQFGLAHSRFQIKFEHPTIRPISITGTAEFNRQKQFSQSQIEFDIFKREDQKIIGLAKAFGDVNLGRGNYNYTAEAKWMSRGLNFEYTAQANSGFKMQPFEVSAQSSVESQSNPNLKFGTTVFANRESFVFDINGMNQNLIHIDGAMNLNDRKINVKGELLLSEQLKAKRILFNGELEISGLKVELKRADNRFAAECELKLAKNLKCTVQGNQKNLMNAKVNLGLTNFMESDVKLDDENLSQFKNQFEIEFKQDSDQALNDLKTKLDQTKKQLINQIEQARANLFDTKKLATNSEQNLNGIVKELEDDPALKEIFDTYRKIYDKLTQLTQSLIKTTKQFYDQMYQIYEDFYKRMDTLFNERILPDLKQLAETIKTNLTEFFQELTKVLDQILAYVSRSLKEFETNLHELLKPIAEVLSPFADIIAEIKKSVEKELSEIWKEFEDLYKKLPELISKKCNELKAKLKEFIKIEDLSKILKEIFGQLEEFAITPELKEFIQKLSQYLDLKLHGREDEKLFSDLMESFVSALTELYETLISGFKLESSDSYLGFMMNSVPIGLPYNMDLLSEVPSFLTTLRFSPFNYLQNENFKHLLSLLSLRSDWLTDDIIPPYELKAHLAGGQHFFTFDNRFFTFPGQKQCRYILAQDSIDNNFTVVVNYNQNSRLQSIQLFDHMATNNLELFSTGELKYNGKPIEYPIHEGDLHAWRRYYTFSLLSTYGVEIKCTKELTVCHLIVNGFYTTKLRGLLGNANSEQYDDFILPNGQIEENYANFGNKYALDNCNPVAFNEKLVSRIHQDVYQATSAAQVSDICQEIFSYTSTNFALAYLFIDLRLYREACHHATLLQQNEKAKLDAACNIALAYASVSRLEDLPVEMPDICLKCGENEIGSSQDVKIPTNLADVVFILDTKIDAQLQKELLQAVLQDLKVQLKQRGFQDINLAVIAYDENKDYPALITHDKGTLNYNGNLDDIKVGGPEKYGTILNDLKFKHDKLNEWLDKFAVVSSKLHTSESEAYLLAFEYPFRAQAAKAVIGTKAYYSSNDWLNQLGATFSDFYFSTNGIQLHMIAPTEINVDGVPSEKIVGFNKRAVATIDGGKDPKKREKLKSNSYSGLDSGWIFALQNFATLKQPELKAKFVHQVTTGIADQMFKTEITQKCYCTAAYGLHAQDKCLVLSTQFVQTKKNTPAKG